MGIVIERVLCDGVVGFLVVPHGCETVRYGASKVWQVNPACILLERAQVLLRYICALVDRDDRVSVTSQYLRTVPRMLRTKHRAAISPGICSGISFHWRGVLDLVHDS